MASSDMSTLELNDDDDVMLTVEGVDDGEKSAGVLAILSSFEMLVVGS